MNIAPTDPIKPLRFALAIEDSPGRRMMMEASYFQYPEPSEVRTKCLGRCTIPHLNLGSGYYLISVSIRTKYAGLLDSVDGGAQFEVLWRNNCGNGEPYSPIYGPVLTDSLWQKLEDGGGSVISQQ